MIKQITYIYIYLHSTHHIFATSFGFPSHTKHLLGPVWGAFAPALGQWSTKVCLQCWEVSKIGYLAGGFSIETYESQWERSSHIYWKINNVWNHQPDMRWYDYKKSMAYRYILRRNHERLKLRDASANDGGWDANEMTWKNPCTTKSMNQWTIESMNRWIDEPTNQWISESMKQRSNHSMNQPTCEPMNQWTNESMKQRSNDSMNQPTSEPMNQWTNESINQWSSESINQWTSWINESMNQYINKWMK